MATGPSLTYDQLDLVRIAQWHNNVKVFTINNVYQVYRHTDVHLSCDGPWWRWYWPKDEKLRELDCLKYTWYPEIAEEYGIQYIKAIAKDGLSTDPGVVHINHGSGPMMVNLAYHFGIRRMILIGHDMRFAPDYDAKNRNPGSIPRHYFGEYPKPLQHWPSVRVRKGHGALDGLIDTYKKMPIKNLGIEILNATPGSALDMFPMVELKDVL